MFKFIIKSDPVKISDIESIFNNMGSVITSTPSKKGTYTSVSIHVDMENPEEWRPLLQKEVRSFFAHTTDIHTLEQFKTIHQIPQKSGTAFHHKAYIIALESLNI